MSASELNLRRRNQPKPDQIRSDQPKPINYYSNIFLAMKNKCNDEFLLNCSFLYSHNTAEMQWWWGGRFYSEYVHWSLDVTAKKLLKLVNINQR